jgi:hypothetical protein
VRAPSRVSIRAMVCAVVATAAAFALVACGDSDDDSDQKLSVTLSGEGKAAKFTTPKTAEAGVAEIEFTNQSDKTADMQLIRVEGDHSAAETIQGLGKAIEGAPFEDWFFGGGGIAVIKPGQSATVTQVLEPGTYYAFNTESDGPPSPSQAGTIEVTGEATDEELEADSVVTAEDADDDYRFEADGLEAGKNEILFENAGEQPHHLLISKIKGDATAEDIEKAFKADKGPPPLEEKGSQSTAVIEGGEGQLVTIDLGPGRYAAYCFITDRDGGKPHALKGMVDEFEVE